MAVQNSDIKFFYSGDGTAIGSLGGEISENEINTGNVNALFDNTTYQESVDGDIEYRCFYVKNSNATDTLYNTKVYFRKNSDSPFVLFSIGLDGEGIGDGKNTGVAEVIVDEDTAPLTPSFSEPSDHATAIAIGNLAAGECVAIWVRRNVSAGAMPINNDTYAITVFGEKSV